MQCRQELIERTYECLQGAPRAIVHFYNSTNPLQREVVFGLDKAGIIDIAVNGAKLCRKLEDTLPATPTIRYEYSPESFTLTEPEFAIEICEAVMDVIEPTPDNPIILNLPATVECYTPNVYGDVIEWFRRTIKQRDSVVISLHPHNDRGCAVAAAEFGVMAGADRVEGTLFGNGERTGNVDVVTLAMNLFMQRRRPRARHQRHRRAAPHGRVLQPPAGASAPPLRRRPGLHGVLRHPPGRDQEGLRGPRRQARRRRRVPEWGVPYLPIDPSTSGRTYEAVIRVNSQSGKGGVAYVMKTEHGFDLPRRLQIEFSKTIQHITEDTGTEISPGVMWDAFQAEYLPDRAGVPPAQPRAAHRDRRRRRQHLDPGPARGRRRRRTDHGEGDGPVEAFVAALVAEFGDRVDGTSTCSTTPSTPSARASNAQAVAYVETVSDGGKVALGRRHRSEHHHGVAARRARAPSNATNAEANYSRADDADRQPRSVEPCCSTLLALGVGAALSWWRSQATTPTPARPPQWPDWPARRPTQIAATAPPRRASRRGAAGR